jgi:hypothetical protein
MALPPVDRMFITSAWLESILYGMHRFIEHRRDGVLTPLDRSQVSGDKRKEKTYTRLISIDSFVLFGICVYVLLDRKSRAHWSVVLLVKSFASTQL